LGGAAAVAGQGAVNALEIDGSRCGFERVRSRPTKVTEGAKKAANYPNAQCSPQSLARRLASPFFLPAASSYHEVLALAKQAKAYAARAEAEAARPGGG
jgi:hypothetical protein